MGKVTHQSPLLGSSSGLVSPTRGEGEGEYCIEGGSRRLEVFKDESWPSAMEDLDHVYEVCAPEWEDTLRSICAEYDDLEDERRNEPELQAVWQEMFEEWRASQEQRLAAARSELPLADQDLQCVVPLSIHLDRYQSTSSQERMDPWYAVLSNWTRFLRLISADEAFSRSLSPAQRSSYSVLEDWWHSRYAYPTPIQATQRYMEQLSAEMCLDSPEEHSELERADREAGIGCSLYHTKCYLLFLKEFHPRCLYLYPVSSSWMSLHYARQEAVEQAICQRMAWTLVGLEQNLVEKPYPQPVRSARIWFESVDFPERPFYLWDSAERRTVIVDLLNECPKYTCVSHTWGRWRKSTCADITGVPWPVPENSLYDVRELPQWLNDLGSKRGTTRYIWFDLFCIPQIRGDRRQQIEIANQASIFRNCERCVAWLNACESFDGVVSALNWLGLRYLLSTSRFDSLDLLEEELDALGELATTNVELLHTNKECPQHMVYPVGWFTSLWTLQEAVLCPDIEICSKNWDVLVDAGGSPISLTTLVVILDQTEFWCRPPRPLDIPFWKQSEYKAAIRELKRQAGDPNAPKHGWESPMFPTAVSALMWFRTYTDLVNVLLTLSPMHVFASATQRNYTRDRAPGIMSALGATDWYRNGQDTAGMQMVQGMFPLAFLQNAAAAIGGMFFAGQPLSSIMGRVVKAVADHPHAAAVGSLLPFHRHHFEDEDIIYNDIFINVRDTFSVVDHPSLRGWAIRADGSVAISQAGILGSGSSTNSSRERCAQVSAVLYDWYGAGSAEYHEGETGDLSGMLAEVAETGCDADPEPTYAFAVALYIDLTDQHGIILRGRRYNYDNDGSRMILVKVGTYIAKGADLPAEEGVDWTVL